MSLNLPHDHGHNEIEEILASTKDDQSFSAIAELFKQVADGTRLRIFWILCHSEECVINLSALMDMSSPAISHHLKLLKSAGLVTSRREEKEVYYRASDSEEARLLHNMIEELGTLVCPDGSCFMR